MSTLEKWKNFWQQKTTPLHRHDTEEYYQSYAAELKILFQSIRPKTILEIGCGNGAMYEYLEFNRARYKGLDFSFSMLDAFSKKYPTLELECCDGSSYQDTNQYDLIFSNGVLQYFDQTMLDLHFSCVKAMMHQESYFVCASIPWENQRFNFYNGELTSKKENLLKGYKGFIKSIFHDNMGYWYNFEDIKKVASKYKMSVAFYGSMHYMYRFHAVIKLR
ncbi:MAG: methyltransferase domain-containing protein [Coleofasciculus sp. G3-WIS-01]|uniref:class I SAM-dependent methyltransferase n=1 Tax=Coleofasciculus sp. G3-WIS-01 TaxID=3069528 RepID=UPI0032F76DDD